MKIAGCYTALVTPFRNGAVDYEALGKCIERQIAAGVAGVSPVGTTGESPTLNMEEHSKVIEFVVEKCAKRCLVIAGTGGNSTEEALRLTREAAAIGADASLQVTPYYNKPTPEGMYRHFSEVADKCGLPVVLYNVPGRTGKEIPVDVIARLSANPLMVAVKEAGGSVERVNQIRDACEITVLSGDDSLTLPMMSVGATGASRSSNLTGIQRHSSSFSSNGWDQSLSSAQEAREEVRVESAWNVGCRNADGPSAPHCPRKGRVGKETSPFGYGLEVGGRAVRAPAGPTFFWPFNLDMPFPRAGRPFTWRDGHLTLRRTPLRAKSG